MKKLTPFLLVSLFLLSGCGRVLTKYTNYKYVNPEEPQNNYGPTVEEGVVLDGLADETFYDNNHVYRINSSKYEEEGDERYAEVRFGFANNGLLAYGYVYEDSIYENSEVVIYQQDSFELYINPTPYKDVLRSSCSQFRISPLLREETWIGIRSPKDDYTWTRYYVPFAYGSHVDGQVITNEEEMYDKSYHNSQGVGYEFYIPYSSLGLDYNPEGLDILPAFVTANSIGEDDLTWSSYDGAGIEELTKYISVGNRKYKPQGNNVFDTDRSSSGFLLSHQLDQDYAYVSNFGFGFEYGYFNAYGDVYYAKADITLFHELNGDPYPKVGIGSINSHGRISALLLDPRPSKDCYDALLSSRHSDSNSDWTWEEQGPSWKGERDYSKPVPVEIIRLHNTIYYFLNYELIYEGNADNLENEDSYPILMCVNYSARFDNYFVSENESDVQNRIIYGPYLTESEYDGYSYDLYNSVYHQNGSGDQLGIFKQKSTSYVMQTKVRIGDRVGGDPYPKIGIGEIDDNGYIQAFLFDPRPGKDNYEMVHLTKNGEIWKWQETSWIGEHSYDRDITLRLERNGTTTKLYMDGIVAFTLTDNNFGDRPTHPMLFAINHTGTFSYVSYSD